MKSRKRRQEESEEEEEEQEGLEEGEEKVYNPVEKLAVNKYIIYEKKLLQEQGINLNDIAKLSDAGFKTVESVMYCTKKALIGVKGIGENKVDKIIEAGNYFIIKFNFLLQNFIQHPKFVRWVLNLLQLCYKKD